MKLFQPIRYEHLVVFGYAFVGTSVLAGYIVHKNLEKRNSEKANAIVKTDGGKMETQNIAVRRIPINSSGIDDMQEKKAEEYFVPASKFMAEADGFENNAPVAAGAAAAKSNPEDGAENARHKAAEKFLDEIEKEEVENEIQKTEAVMDGNNAQHRADIVGNIFLRYRGKLARIFTNDGKIITGKFAGMDTHVVLEDAEYGSEKNSLLMISKSEIARMEIE